MKPILFNTEMVQAILEGRKTVTRRVVKNVNSIYRPFEIGDILYVRETWQLLPSGFAETPPECWYIYKATDELSDECTRWHPSIHMPKEAARIFLKVNDVRVERLQDVTVEQVEKEGIYSEAPYTKEHFAYRPGMLIHFSRLWDSTIKKQDLDKYGWEANPLVWVIEFQRVEVK